MEWDKKTKPPADICPGKYCFSWVSAAGAAAMLGLVKEGCPYWSGVCSRNDQVAGDVDLYEPHEPQLEEDGLPWFYFISSTQNLVPQLHEAYLRESQILWGCK